MSEQGLIAGEKIRTLLHRTKFCKATRGHRVYMNITDSQWNGKKSDALSVDVGGRPTLIVLTVERPFFAVGFSGFARGWPGALSVRYKV